jgi:phytoene dehydrogenase-like protein
VRHGIGNLHLAGHWGDTGGGVLAAAYSGMRVAARILRAST